MKTASIVLTSVMFLFAFPTFAEISFTIGNCDLSKETTTIPIYVQSTDPSSDLIKALQFDVKLPEGITFCDDHSIASTFNETSSFKNNDKWDYSFSEDLSSTTIIYTNSKSNCYLKVSTDKQLLMTLNVSVSSGFEGGVVAFEGMIGGYTENKIDYPVTITGVDYYYNYQAGTIGTGGLSTFSCPAGVLISGATAYYGTVKDESFVMTAFAENKVPAETGAVLKGNAGDPYTISSVEVSALTETNDLIASVNRTEVAASSTYVIATGNDGTGFYLYTGTAIPAGKAYLDVPTEHSGAPLRVISNATGIEELESNNNAVEAYSLFGNKTENSNGQVIIENGKKIIRH